MRVLEQVEFVAARGGLGARGHAQLAEDVGHMGFDRPLGNDQLSAISRLLAPAIIRCSTSVSRAESVSLEPGIGRERGSGSAIQKCDDRREQFRLDIPLLGRSQQRQDMIAFLQDDPRHPALANVDQRRLKHGQRIFGFAPCLIQEASAKRGSCRKTVWRTLRCSSQRGAGTLALRELARGQAPADPAKSDAESHLRW